MLVKRRSPAGDGGMIRLAPVRVEVTSKPFSAVEADLHAIGLLEGDELPAELRGIPGAGDVKPRFEKLNLLRPERPR